MKAKKQLLLIDGWVNLILGVLLGIFPKSFVNFLGAPPSNSFYPSILGAVLFGVGLALLIERNKGSDGLGVKGAITINFCGSIVLALWFLFGGLGLATKGYVALWALVVIVFGIGLVELTHLNKKA